MSLLRTALHHMIAQQPLQKSIYNDNDDFDDFVNIVSHSGNNSTLDE